MTREEFYTICGRDHVAPANTSILSAPARDRRALLALVREIAEAAERVECTRCSAVGIVRDPDTNMGGPCPDCTPLRELLEVVKVTCKRCNGKGFVLWEPETDSCRTYEKACPDCADARRNCV